jgi:hypothetical protein
MNDAQILNSTLNGNGFGVRVASAVTSMDGMFIDGCTMNNNNSSAITTNPSGTLSNVNTNFTVSNCTFNNNGTSGVANQHDLSFFAFSGNAVLSNITLTSGNGTASNSNSYGIVFTRGSGSGPLGTVSLSNVTVQGHVGKGALTFQKYSDISNVSLNNVSLNNCVAPWGSLILDHTDADAFNAGNTSLRSIVLWNSGGATATSVNYYHATSNTLLDRSILTNCFQMEDQTVHKVDASVLGLVRVKAGELFVTTSSFASPTTTTPDIQRAIDAATAGDIISVGSGTYTVPTNGTINVNKAVSLRGINYQADPTVTPSVRGAESKIVVNHSSGRAMTVSVSNVSVDGFEFEVQASRDAINVMTTLNAGGSASISSLNFSNNIFRSGTTSTSQKNGILFGENNTNANPGATIDTANITNVTIHRNLFDFTTFATSARGIPMTAQFDWLNYSGFTISNNHFKMGSTNANGIVATAVPNRHLMTNFTITGNNFSGYAGIDITKSSNPVIENNTFNGLVYRAVAVGSTNGGAVRGNTIDGTGAALLSGGQYYGYGIDLYGGTDFATPANGPTGNNAGLAVENNVISNFTHPTETNQNFRAINVRNNAGTGMIIRNNAIDNVQNGVLFASTTVNAQTVENNSFTNAGTAIRNNSSSVSIGATCNWYGSLNAQTIASKISGSVTHSPWLIDGTDGSASSGFQPSGACTGTAPAIASTVTNVSCYGLANGSIDITVSGGLAPYSYAWNGGSTDEDRIGLTPASYTVTVTDANGSTVSSTFTVTQPAPPSAAGMISGINEDCRTGVAASEPFSVPASTNATTYTWSWTGTSGVTISNNGSQNITLDYTATAIQGGITGTLTVTPSDICGNTSTSSSVAVEYQGAAPVTPASISGDGKLCPGDVKTFSIAAVSRATSYNWTVPANTTISSGTGTNIITVTVGAAYTGGEITVSAENVCAVSPVRTKAVTNNLVASPGTITGLSTGMCGESGVSYSIAAVTGATAYTWSVTGGTIASGQNTTAITVNWSLAGTSGSISVTSGNACGTSSARTLSVTKTPARPSAIAGVTTPACTSSVANASVSTVTGATSYLWAITSGGAITGGQGTKDAQVTWGTAAASSQSVTVRAGNSCGNGLTRALTGISVVACSRDQAAGSSDLQMLVYPNPAHDWMMLNFSSDSEQRYQVRLTDMSGRAVLVQDGTSDAGANQLQLTPGSISSGVYMLQLTIDGKHAVQRIVIE